MVRLLDGDSEKGEHVRSNLCYLICLRHLIGLRAVTNRIFIFPIFHACVICSELPSNISSITEEHRGEKLQLYGG